MKNEVLNLKQDKNKPTKTTFFVQYLDDIFIANLSIQIFLKNKNAIPKIVFL